MISWGISSIKKQNILVRKTTFNADSDKGALNISNLPIFDTRRCNISISIHDNNVAAPNTFVYILNHSKNFWFDVTSLINIVILVAVFIINGIIKNTNLKLLS